MRPALLFIAFVLLSYASGAQRMPELIPYTNDTLWGYSDTFGHVRIPPRWKEAGFFKGDRARVQVNIRNRTAYALINRKGEYIIPPERGWDGYWRGGKNVVFNVSDTEGYFGLVDPDNRLWIPTVYKNQSLQFHYNSWWQCQCMKVLRKDGKAGIIDLSNRTLLPFDYNQLNLAPGPEEDSTLMVHSSIWEHGRSESFSPDMQHYIIATKDGKQGLINTQNEVIIPFGQYTELSFGRPCWILCRKDNQHGVLDTMGKTVVPLRHPAPLIPAGSDFFIARYLATNHWIYGLVSPSGDTVLPFRYSEMRSVKDTLTISQSDSTAPPEYGDQENGTIAGSYVRRLNPRNLQAYGSWVYQPAPVFLHDFHNFCGTAAANQAMYDEQERKRPCIPIAGKCSKEFEKDGKSWWTVMPAGQGLYAIQGRVANDYYAHLASAIIDEKLRFVTGPVMGGIQLQLFNQKDGLIVAAKSLSGRDISRYGTDNYPINYAVLDTAMHEIIPWQGRRIVAAFRWQGRVYALTGTADYEHYIYVGDPDAELWNLRYRREEFDHYGTVIDSSGQPCAALSSYEVLHFTHSDGTQSASFEGYFLATDSQKRKGIVGLNGQVHNPTNSFRSRDYRALGHGWYQMPQNGYYTWVNTQGEEFIPGLRTYSIEPATPDDYSYEAFAASRPPFFRVAVPGVYKIQTVSQEGRWRTYYLTVNDVVHGAHPK